MTPRGNKSVHKDAFCGQTNNDRKLRFENLKSTINLL